MRTATLIRLLNSTPLGIVIAPHRMYRHRALAGGHIEQNGKVQLAKYAAWLMEVRVTGQHLMGHRFRSRRPIRFDGSVNKAGILALLADQDYRCALSGRRLTPQRAALDHIVPVSRGGEHRIGNAQVLDKLVNRAKGTLTNEEFIRLCGRVWRYAASRNRRSPARPSGVPCPAADLADGQGLLFPPQNQRTSQFHL